MSIEHECPKCGEPMEFQEADPDVGIEGPYWYCSCGHGEPAEYDIDPDWER